MGESERRDFRRLVSLLEQPLAAAGVGPDKRPVYHLVIAARKVPDTGAMVDRHLADDAWRDIAAAYLDRIGLAPRGDDLGVRWGRGPARRRPRARGGQPGPGLAVDASGDNSVNTGRGVPQARPAAAGR